MYFLPYFLLLHIVIAVSCCNNKCVVFVAVTSEIRGKWESSKRSSISKEDINVVRWEQLKHTLQSGQKKVKTDICALFLVGNGLPFGWQYLFLSCIPNPNIG